MSSPLPFLFLLAFPVVLAWFLSPRWAIFKNPFGSKQKCHQGCNALCIYCKETSLGCGAGVPGLILLPLQVHGVSLGKLPLCLMRSWRGSLPRTLQVLMFSSGAGGGVKQACRRMEPCLRTVGLHRKGRLWGVLPRFFPALAGPQTPIPGKLLPVS